MNDNSKKPPIGQRVRAILEPLLEKEETHELMYKLASDYFAELAQQLPQFMETSLRSFFNTASLKNPTARDFKLTKGLTIMEKDPGISEPFPIVAKLALNVSNEFTNFTAAEIKSMPGFVALHEKLREMDVAAKFNGLTIEDKNSGYTSGVMTLDFSKDYLSGALQSPGLYPDLPEQESTNTAKKKPPSGNFTL